MNTQLIKMLPIIGLLLVLFSTCSQEDEIIYRLNTNLVKLNCKGTQTLQVTPALEGLSYTSLNTNIATVTSEGLVRAKLVGTTNIVVKDSLNRFVDTVKVFVNSSVKAFDDPYLGFGETDLTVLENIDASKGEPFNYYAESFWKMTFYYVEADISLRNIYYFSNENKLLFSSIEKQIDDLEWEMHLSDRYSLMKTVQPSSKDQSGAKIYNRNSSCFESYYINPDSSMIILQLVIPSEANGIVYYFPAIKEAIPHIVSADEDQGAALYAWFINSYLPD